jgi:hypothetical protein
MDGKKLFERTCPKCGVIYQDCEIAKVIFNSGVQVNMLCHNGHKWTEFYNFNYQGYWWNGKMYDAYGEERNKEL